MTIPCVGGPYTGIHCRLTLLSSKTRVSPVLVDPPEACCRDTRIHNNYHAYPDDPRVVNLYSATEAIATSSGQNDSGMFELNFRDERYLPFEYKGAVSRWRIELPRENNLFDISTVSDLLIHLNYTAREGGDLLRNAANNIAQQHLPGNGIRLFDLIHEFPDAWYLMGEKIHTRRSGKRMDLRLSSSMFPYIQTHKEIHILRLELFFEIKGLNDKSRHIVEFLTRYTIGNREEDTDVCKTDNIYCEKSSEWPGFYHGVLNIKLGPLAHAGADKIGTFRFPEDIGEIGQAFLFCGYSIDKNQR